MGVNLLLYLYFINQIVSRASPVADMDKIARPHSSRAMVCPFDPSSAPSRGHPDSFHVMFDIMEPVMGVPESCKFSTIAKGDGEKHVCMGMFPPRETPSAQCSIVSVGSNNEYDFELDIFDRMPCEIYVFDCTVLTPTPPEKLSKSGRFFFHQLCIGASEDRDKGFVSWRTLALLASRNATQPILSLKMDVEGWEFETLTQIAAPEMQRLQLVPMQIACEIHQRAHTKWNVPHFWPIPAKPSLSMVSPEQVLQLKQKMQRAGYVLADRNDNPFCKACSEVVFLHVNMYGLYEPLDWSRQNDSLVDAAGLHSAHVEHLLGVHSLLRNGGAHHSKAARSRAQQRVVNTTLSQSPHGFLSLYVRSEVDVHNCSSFLSSHPPCAHVLSKRALEQALLRYGQRRPLRVASPTPEDTKELTIHLRVGDKGALEQGFLEAIAVLMSQHGFGKLVVYSGIHPDYRLGHPWDAACRLEASLHALRQQFGPGRVEFRLPRSADDDLYALARARHLLVHRGAQAALLAMASSGTVYLPERMLLEHSDAFYRMLSNSAVAIARNGSALPAADWIRAVKG
eukprot:gene30098-36353_t